jgi:hypothetical protein
MKDSSPPEGPEGASSHPGRYPPPPGTGRENPSRKGGILPSPEPPPEAAAATTPPPASGLGAAMVGAGILLSRVLGLVREHLRARYIGAGVAADAWTVAFRLPNLLQNLFGEAALSA